MKYILLFIVGVAGYWLGTSFAQKRKGESAGVARTAAGAKKEERKKKILALFDKKEKITNDDVQNLLGVADSTATNYLDELEKEGLVVQKGDSGRGVYYENLLKIST